MNKSRNFIAAKDLESKNKRMKLTHDLFLKKVNNKKTYNLKNLNEMIKSNIFFGQGD